VCWVRRTKEELFLELYSASNSDRIAEAAAVLHEQEEGTQDAVDAMGKVLVDAADKDADFALLQAEFWLYAARNPRVLGAMVTQMREPRTALEQLITNALADRKVPREATPQAVAVLVAALFDGLVRQRRINPDQVPEDLFGHALRWLFAGIDATGTRTPVKPARRTKTS
jgi:AcrR family transcriptional regulator